MFLNPLLRKKLLQKKDYMIEQDNNPFVPSKIIDERIYLQVEQVKEVEYKKIILKDKGLDIPLIQDVDVVEVKEDVDVDDVVEDVGDEDVGDEGVKEVKEDEEDEEDEEVKEDQNVEDINILSEQKNIKKISLHSFY